MTRILQRPEIPDMGHLLPFLLLQSPLEKARTLKRHLLPGREFLRRRYGRHSARAVVLHTCARPLLTVWNTLRLLYRIATTPPDTSPALRGEVP